MKNLGIEFDISSDITIRYFITSKDQIIHLEEKSFSKPDEFLFKENSFILSRIDEDNYLPNKCDNKHSNTKEYSCYDDSTKSNLITNMTKQKKEDSSTINKAGKIICGRKRKNPLDEINKVHDKYSRDNLQRKVKVHFLTFVIEFLNEIIATLGLGEKFIDIDYQIKKQVKQDVISKLKMETIAELLGEKISGKFKNKIKENPFQNKIIYEKIIQQNNKELNSIFSQSLISFFKNVYCKKEKHFVINGKTITLSDRVKNYEDLLDSCDNDRYREKIKEEVQNTYFKKPFQVNIQNEES